MINLIKNEIKLRQTAQPFDIRKEEVCTKGKNDLYWLCSDGMIYYGIRWFIFFKSAQNSWWLKKER